MLNYLAHSNLCPEAGKAKIRGLVRGRLCLRSATHFDTYESVRFFLQRLVKMQIPLNTINIRRVCSLVTLINRCWFYI